LLSTTLGTSFSLALVIRSVRLRFCARLKHDGLIATSGRTLIIPDVRALKLYAANAHKAVLPTGSL
jgi:hypothetical protein